MGISPVGASHAHGHVSKANSAAKLAVPEGGISLEGLPETRKNLPEHAKGLARGHSTQKFLDKVARLDADGDGKISQTELGASKFGRGVMAMLLKLQEMIVQPPPPPPPPAPAPPVVDETPVVPPPVEPPTAEPPPA
jgi:hypothetical protein